MHIPEHGIRLTVGTRAHRKYVLRQFKSAGMTDDFYQLAFSENSVHIRFEQSQNDPDLALTLFEEHPRFLSWHMLMTSGILVWNVVTHPPFSQRYPEVAVHVMNRPE